MSSNISVAVLGVGMMGQEHISYMSKYPQIQIKYLCDTNSTMVQKAMALITAEEKPECFAEEKDLLKRASEIDLLVIATPNFMHTPHLLRWAKYPICILVEKPVAISEKQVFALQVASPSFEANIWVAMEYRYIPAIQKLYQLLPSIGPIKNVTIRENRFPFLTKISKCIN
jgi:myo-inositol 2-dehydrogenase/D-chiro-inositol 1-dehydrogenase